MKKKINIKHLIIDSSITLLFILSLILLINFYNTDKIEQTEKKIIFSEGSDIMFQNKFNIIGTSVIYGLNNLTIKDTDIKYISKLIVENKIYNQENSFGQEIISHYKNNQTNISKKISKELINNIYDRFDEKIDRKWRNSELILVDNKNNNNITLYKNHNILVNYNSSNIKSEKSINISIYEFQTYIFTLENNSKKEVKINLITKKSIGSLEDFIDPITQKPKIKLNNIKTIFEKSNKSFELIYRIYK